MGRDSVGMWKIVVTDLTVYTCLICAEEPILCLMYWTSCTDEFTSGE